VFDAEFSPDMKVWALIIDGAVVVSFGVYPVDAAFAARQALDLTGPADVKGLFAVPWLDRLLKRERPQ
jgi:hypothetical protein